jgi:hypothetical protein
MEGKIKNVNHTGFLNLVKDGDLMFTLSLIKRGTKRQKKKQYLL